MEVIGHQNVREKNPIKALDRRSKEVKKKTSVDIVSKDVAALVPARRDVPKGSGILKSKGS